MLRFAIIAATMLQLGWQSQVLSFSIPTTASKQRTHSDSFLKAATVEPAIGNEVMWEPTSE